MSENQPQHEISYLHIRPPRSAGAGGHANADIVGNRAGLLRLREHIDAALAAGEGMGSMHWNGYREIDGLVYGLMVLRAHRPDKMGEAKKPEPPDYSRLMPDEPGGGRNAAENDSEIPG